MKTIAPREEIIDLLTQDAYYRKIRKWPLLTSSNFLSKTLIKRKYQNVLLLGVGRGYQRSISNENVKRSLNIKHPFTSDLLSQFKNHLVACGGAVTKAIIGVYDSGEDIDFFFYDLNIEQAIQLRIDIIKFLVNKWKADAADVDFYVLRNEYTTTLYVYDGGPDTYVYQFIHRIYPDMSSILGGFDISASMVAFDGQELYATPLGTWSILNIAIIIDTKRRSTSYETRLLKYYRYGFKLIFPGLTETIIRSHLIDPRNNNFTELMDKINQLIYEHGYEINEDRQINLSDIISETKYPVINKSYELQKKENILPTLYLHGNIAIATPAYNRENVEDRFINKISDYSHDHMWSKCFPHANAARLRLDNLNSVVSILHLNIDSHNITDKLLYDIEHPDLGVNDDTIIYFKNRVEKVREYNDKPDYVRNCHYRRLLKCFGKLTPEVIKIIDTPDYYNYRDLMIEKMLFNAKICREKLIGIKWITINPGRQWTSSINPVFANPRDWYGKHYILVLAV